MGASMSREDWESKDIPECSPPASLAPTSTLSSRTSSPSLSSSRQRLPPPSFPLFGDAQQPPLTDFSVAGNLSLTHDFPHPYTLMRPRISHSQPSLSSSLCLSLSRLDWKPVMGDGGVSISRMKQ
ncbi:hypothetical protein LXL04_032361 [Taraxacum kok-saghyz]